MQPCLHKRFMVMSRLYYDAPKILVISQAVIYVKDACADSKQTQLGH